MHVFKQTHNIRDKFNHLISLQQELKLILGIYLNVDKGFIG